MASLNQILSNPGMAIGLPAIQGEGYRLAGLPDLPTNYIWDYQVDAALPASDPNAWLPALDLVKIQRETGPSIADNLLAMGKFALSIFTSPSVLDLGSLYQSTEKLAAQELAITASVEAKTEQLQQAVLLRRAQETQPMFDDFGWDSIGDFFSDSYDSISSFASDLPYGAMAGSLLPVASSFLPGPARAIPVMAGGGQAIQRGVQAMAGGVGAATTRAVVGRTFFNRWPNLATALQRFKNAGQNVTRAQLYSMLKRFGPDFLITGGILTAAAVSELMMSGSGRRRMNPGNVKALRRSMRRLESFHHLCQKSDKLRKPRARSRSKCA